MIAATGKRVAIWRTDWLPPSETFVINQADALDRWNALRFGLRRLPGGLDVDVDRTPFNSRRGSRLLYSLSSRLDHRFVFDHWLADMDVRVIHAHFGPGAIEVLPIARRVGLPLIVTFHGFDVTRAPTRPDKIGQEYKAGLMQVFRYASRLIAVSEFVRDRLIALGAPPDKITVHYIGIPVGSQKIVVDPSRSGICFVGRLITQKGAHHLIESVAALPDTLRETVPVRIVGAGPNLEKLKALAAEKGVNVQFLGHQSASEVQRILASSSVFCAPSISHDGAVEAFGLVYLEAALQGLPVVAYASGGVSEAVIDGRTGLLAPEGDTEQLSSNLMRVLDDPVLASDLGSAGRARVLQDFDISIQTGVLEDIYDACDDGGVRRR